MKGKKLNLSQNSEERLYGALTSFALKGTCGQAELKSSLEEYDIAVGKLVPSIHRILEQDQLIMKIGRSYKWKQSNPLVTEEDRKQYTDMLLHALADKKLIKEDTINPYAIDNYKIANAFLKNGGVNKKLIPVETPIQESTQTPKISHRKLESFSIEELVGEFERRGFEITLKHIMK